MSAVPSPVFDETPQRISPRHPINVPLDLIALRSGVPENLPGRCTDISEAGVGAVVAGELATGQQVALELRLPNVGVPVRARALVRYQSRLRCGLEFVGLTVEQREMIRYWVYRSSSQPVDFRDFKQEENGGAAKTEAAVAAAELAAKPRRRVRIGRRRFYLLIACMLALAALGWWQWQRSWNDLEKRGPVGESRLRVSPETMEKRIVTKTEPVYPEAARTAGKAGLVVLDAVIAPDGSVKQLRPVSGSDLLVQSATEAVQSWKFEPYLSSGKAVEVETTIVVEFRLN
ncbi:MAG: TonB family protein [Terriglobales bacterium]|jgi:TonB family protein